ncbi:MAG: hypothetical protein ACI8Z0_002660, partial [Lentimonas sp.]
GANTLSLGYVPAAKTCCNHQLCLRAAKAGILQFKQSVDPRVGSLDQTAPTRFQWAILSLYIAQHLQRIMTRAVRSTKYFIIMCSFFHLK